MHSGRGGRYDRRQANIPYNKEGRIGGYAKDGGRRALEKVSQGEDNGLLGESGPKFLGRKYAPTMDQIHQDRLTSLSNQFWSPQTLKKHMDYNSTFPNTEEFHLFTARIIDSERLLLVVHTA